MIDTTIKKIQSSSSPKGPQGERYLASGKRLAMRLWEDEPPGEMKPVTRREYETVGYVLQGRARLHLEGQVVELAPGDCWIVPADARHRYEIIETFSAVEATSPPAWVHGRDEVEQ
jgi:quercetin dioxygenase-like cupin family protein